MIIPNDQREPSYCQECGELATVHVVEIIGGKAEERHLCDLHAGPLVDSMGPASVGFGAGQMIKAIAKKLTQRPGMKWPAMIEMDYGHSRVAQKMTCDQCGQPVRIEMCVINEDQSIQNSVRYCVDHAREAGFKVGEAVRQIRARVRHGQT